MGDNENSHLFLSIMNEISQKGMNKNHYERIATEFSSFQSVPPAYLLSLLRHFVKFEDCLLYTNEIKNYLRENDTELFLEYGNRFRNCRGCLEVFGIVPVNQKKYDFVIVPEDKREPVKMSINKKERKTEDRLIKKRAKEIAADKYKKKIEKNNEKKRKQDEIQRLIRKQDL